MWPKELFEGWTDFLEFRKIGTLTRASDTLGPTMQKNYEPELIFFEETV
jgi:hypothetical protein